MRLLCSLIIFSILFEIGFRVVRNAGWFGADYGDVFSMEDLHEGGYLIPNTDLEVRNGLGGKVKWTNNSKGFRNEKEFTYEKPDNTIRILSMGDSFTSGYRVSQHETYSHLLEQSLNQDQDSVKYEVMVANVSNPLTGLEYLTRHGLKYKPDIVILGITLGNDLSECFIHLSGTGKKRLIHNSVTDNPDLDAEEQSILMNEAFPVNTYRPIPQWQIYWSKLILPKIISSAFSKHDQGEPVFAMKGKSPIYIHDFTHGLGLFLKKPPVTIDLMFTALEETLRAYDRLSIIEGFELKIAFFPQRYQVNPLDQKALIADFGLIESEFDWIKPNRHLGDFCREVGLNCTDLLPALQKEQRNFNLPNGDMHWNSLGHQIVSEVLLESFRSQ